MTKEEIKDYLEMNMEYDIDKVVDYIFKLESERNRYKEATETAQMLLKDTVTKERYNSVVKKYNDLAKRRGIK